MNALSIVSSQTIKQNKKKRGQKQMTIQELKRREENRKKNRQLLKDGRLTIEGDITKMIYLDGVHILPYWEKEFKEWLSKFDFEELKAEAIKREEERKRKEAERTAKIKELSELLNNNGYELRTREDDNSQWFIHRNSDGLKVDWLSDFSKVERWLNIINNDGIELLNAKAEDEENIITNENNLKEKEAEGIITRDRFGKFTDNRSGKKYYYNEWTLKQDYSDKECFINWIIFSTDLRKEEARKDEEARQEKEKQVIALLTANGVKYKPENDAFYFKRSKVAQLEAYDKIISFNSYYGTYKLDEKVKKMFDDLGLSAEEVETEKE